MWERIQRILGLGLISREEPNQNLLNKEDPNNESPKHRDATSKKTEE
jgi:hypothetical protein